jgi:hypothetical protein
MRASVLCDVGRLEVRDIPRPVISLTKYLYASEQLESAEQMRTSLRVMQIQHEQRGLPIPLALQPQILGTRSAEQSKKLVKASQT